MGILDEIPIVRPSDWPRRFQARFQRDPNEQQSRNCPKSDFAVEEWRSWYLSMAVRTSTARRGRIGTAQGPAQPRTRWVSRRIPSNPTGCCGSGTRRTRGRRTILESRRPNLRSRRRSAAPPVGCRDARPRQSRGRTLLRLPTVSTLPRRSRRRGRRTGRDRPHPSGARGPRARPPRRAAGREPDPRPRSSEAPRRPRGGPRRPPAVRQRPLKATAGAGPPGGPSPRT